jgi:ribosomal protein S18 acetylase RimI-like enzyme
VTVRSLAWADFEGLYALRMRRYDQIAEQPDFGMFSNPKRPTESEFAVAFGELHRDLLEGRGVCSVAEETGRIVGACSVRPRGPHLETRHVGNLGIEVLPEFRDRGLGAALLRHALAACRGRFEEVHLEVIPENPRARHLYEKLGFELYGTAPRGFQRGGAYRDFLLMRKRVE